MIFALLKKYKRKMNDNCLPDPEQEFEVGGTV